MAGTPPPELDACMCGHIDRDTPATHVSETPPPPHHTPPLLPPSFPPTPTHHHHPPPSSPTHTPPPPPNSFVELLILFEQCSQRVREPILLRTEKLARRQRSMNTGEENSSAVHEHEHNLKPHGESNVVNSAIHGGGRCVAKNRDEREYGGPCKRHMVAMSIRFTSFHNTLHWPTGSVDMGHGVSYCGAAYPC